MSVTLVNYATPEFEGWRALSNFTARKSGCERIAGYGPDDLEVPFQCKNHDLLSEPKGAGLWLWKPWSILRAMTESPAGGYLLYADSGVLFVNPIHPITEFMRRKNLHVLNFGAGFSEWMYTKRDAFILTDTDREPYLTSPQRFASALAFQVTEESCRFVEKWLKCCEDPRMLSDQANQCGKSDYPAFVRHRHDQSLFSLLSKKDGIPFLETGFLADGFPPRGQQIMNHPRTRLAPGALLTRLVAQGVIEHQELPELENPSS